ncbi:unnamed protein product [Cuscuta campestris]|uniref:CCHC-type domain-containing protein n=1 Tax=Cuscuta campestris TaxID=132261 RepID=A0A484KG88_9ASTE|nr:unnamed protein product [Cuscuta campestris]
MNPSGSGFFLDNLAPHDAAMWYFQEFGDHPPIFETQQSGYVERDSVPETQPEPSGSKKSTRRKSHKAKGTVTEAARSIQKWTPEEECLLASAWVDVSEHPIIAPNMGIETLNGANFSSWKDSLMLTLGMLDFDYALREPAPPALTDKSTVEDKIVHERWERCNRMALMLIKNSISIIIRGAIPDSSNAKTYLASVEEQFKATSKAHASTLILKMVTTKYDGNSGIREHIMMMNDMARKLKGLDMEISEGFLVHFIMTSLPASFEAFKVNYNTQKVKWSMNELIAMCVQEEERLKLDKPDVAYLMTAYPKKRKGNVDKKEVSKVQKRDASASSSSKNSKGKSYCKFCRKEGHRQKDC